LRRYQPKRHNFDVLSALSAIKQGDDEPFSKYYSRCEAILLKADDSLSEDLRTGAIVRGLNPKLFHKVVQHNFDSVEELCEMVTSIE